jgi:hypothetical protein
LLYGVGPIVPAKAGEMATSMAPTLNTAAMINLRITCTSRKI